ncbi:hypothetical protein ACKI1O_52915, partial [Streptomyces scabiei]
TLTLLYDLRPVDLARAAGMAATAAAAALLALISLYAGQRVRTAQAERRAAQALASANLGLERKVAERTAALAQANQDLRR